jgi:hypothetical protein
MTTPRLALVTALAAAAILLAGCAPSTPSTPTEPDPTPTPSEPTVIALEDLEYPAYVDAWVSSLDESKQALVTWQTEYFAECDAEQAATAESPCVEGILEGLRAVNAVKTNFDFSPYSNEQFEDTSFTGMVVLNASRTAIQSASDVGSDAVDQCYYVPGGETCPEVLTGFFDELDAAVVELQTWEV